MQSVSGVTSYYNYDHLGSVNTPNSHNLFTSIHNTAIAPPSLLRFERCNLWVVLICDPWLLVRELGRCDMGFGKVWE
jgi:hypothetical protein